MKTKPMHSTSLNSRDVHTRRTEDRRLEKFTKDDLNFNIAKALMRVSFISCVEVKFYF